MSKSAELQNIEIAYAMNRVRVVLQDTSRLHALGYISQEEFNDFMNVFAEQQERLMELISAVTT